MTVTELFERFDDAVAALQRIAAALESLAKVYSLAQMYAATEGMDRP